MRIQTLLAALSAVTAAAVSVTAQSSDGFRFRSGVELVNVTATVTDESGRFVSGLRKDDFTVYDDGVRQEVSHFSSDRVPVSLGIVLDTSGSMTSDKIATAQAAIDRFIYDLLGKDDELFFMEFANRPRITQQWTRDRRLISRAVGRVNPSGGTALYEAVADALPLASAGENRKKAILVISDGNDSNSDISVGELRQLIRESEVMVYALGVDASGSRRSGGQVTQPPTSPIPVPFPFPFPGGRRPALPQITGGILGGRNTGGERVNGAALRQITDDTGGRTEIVRGFEGLDAATARIADELSKQYYLAYASTGEKDGRWHAIRVEVRDRRFIVRARRGYVAS
jgi:VWFA-related protein